LCFAEDDPRREVNVASDYFLKIDGIEGDSTDVKHKGEIEPQSFGWGVAQSAVATGRAGGAGAGKPQFRDLVFVQRVGKSSTKLFLACATGQHLKEATLSAHTSGKTPLEFLTIKLTDVVVSSFEEAATDGEHPFEHVALRFAKIELTYRPQGPAGKAGPALKAGYDLKLNKKV